MDNKIVISIVIVLLLVLGIVVGYGMFNHQDISNDDRTILNVSSEGPIELSKIVKDIKTSEYYGGYDNETLKWMESLGDRYVFVSSDEFVIMNKVDADKIPSIYACDVSFYEIFSCNVLENHSIGDVKYSRDVLLVEDVKYICEDVRYYDV